MRAPFLTPTCRAAELFKCAGIEPEPPAAVVMHYSQHAEATAADCADLKKDACESNSHCAWCESAAVPSACYTVEQAQRLPPAVFSCHLPSAAA